MEGREGAGPISRIVRSYKNPIIRGYSAIRFVILRQIFLEEIGQYLPTDGRILDIGCGFGLFSLYFAALEPGREILGIDLSSRRINHARKSAERLGLGNVEYELSDVLEWRSEAQFDAIYLLDVVHHLPVKEVPKFLSRLRGQLREGGVLLVKEVENRPRWKMWFALVLDRLMVGMEPIRYWPESELRTLLESLGFQVVRHRMRDILPYPHILYVCRLPSR